MNRDEILEKSRKENKVGDERQLAIREKSKAISSVIGLMLCCIVAFLEGILGDTVILFYGCFGIYFGMTSAEGIVATIINKKKSAWIFVIISSIIFIGFMIKLILELI